MLHNESEHLLNYHGDRLNYIAYPEGWENLSEEAQYHMRRAEDAAFCNDINGAVTHMNAALGCEMLRAMLPYEEDRSKWHKTGYTNMGGEV
jgi:hypothetical protein